MIRTFDDFIIDRLLQPVVDVIWHLTGSTRYHMARLCAVLLVISGLAPCVAYRSTTSGTQIGLVIAITVWLYWIISRIVSRYEARDGNSAADVMPAARAALRWTRIFFLIGVAFAGISAPFPPTTFAVFSSWVNAISTTLAFYVISCRGTLPPGLPSASLA